MPKNSNSIQLELQDFANIVQNAGEGILIYQNRKIIFINQKAAELAGLPAEQMIGQDIFDFIPAPNRTEIQAKVKERETGKVATDGYEITLLTSQGEPREFWISSKLITLKDQACVLCFLSDISAQKKAAADLQRSEAKYRQLIDEAHDAILLSDKEGNFFEVNSRAIEMFGYSEEEFLRMNIRELIFSKDMELKPLRLPELAAGQVITTQRTLRRKDGTEFTAEVSGKTLPDGTVQGTVRDLSERKDAEKRLRLIVEGTSHTLGENFLKDLVKYLASALEVKYTFISEKRGEESEVAYPLVLWAEDHYETIPPYPITGTPCEQVWRNNKIFVSQDAAKEFPEDTWLSENHIKSYIGLPLVNSENELLGHLAVLDDKPIENLILAETIMRIFAARASAELERKITEESWRQYEFIVNSSRDLMTLIDRDFRYIAVNDAYCEAHQLPRNKIIGKTVSEIWGEGAFNKIIRSHLENCFAGNDFHEQSWIQPAHYTQPGFFDVSYYPYYDSQGEVTHAIVVSRDITDRKQAELELQYRLEFEKLITSLSTHFINLANSEIDSGIKHALQEIGSFTDVDTCFIFVGNEESTHMQLLHQWYAPHQHPNMHLWESVNFCEFPWVIKMLQRQRTIVIPTPQVLPAEENVLKQVMLQTGLRSLILVPIVFRRKLRGAVGFATETEDKTLPPNADSILRIVGEMFGNALDRKETGEKLNHLYDMQSNLFSSIAHSLKTPFSVILGNITMLEKDIGSSQESKELLEGIRTSASQANEKVTQLLKVAQLDISPIHTTEEIIDLDTTISQVVNQGKYLFQAYYTISRDIINQRVQSDVRSGAKINADAKSISDLILTLLDNAFKHSPAPGELPEVIVSTKRKGNKAIIQITDKGKGISQDHLEHIFDLYYQIDKEQGGFGIGLAFCKKMVETLGGKVEAFSQLRKGTTFQIELPVAD